MFGASKGHKNLKKGLRVKQRSLKVRETFVRNGRSETYQNRVEKIGRTDHSPSWQWPCWLVQRLGVKKDALGYRNKVEYCVGKSLQWKLLSDWNVHFDWYIHFGAFGAKTRLKIKPKCSLFDARAIFSVSSLLSLRWAAQRVQNFSRPHLRIWCGGSSA